MLVDSHVLIDILEDRGRIGRRTRALLQEEMVLVSAATLWELTIKVLAGRLQVRGHLAAGVEEAGFRQLPVLPEHALRIGEVTELQHSDPFDRLLLAQAKVEGLDFYTWDRSILAAGLPFVRDARA
jgi:PIN domain nuclease of toxin-antitoxin system